MPPFNLKVSGVNILFSENKLDMYYMNTHFEGFADFAIALAVRKIFILKNNDYHDWLYILQSIN